jgi:hypothetical protein
LNPIHYKNYETQSRFLLYVIIGTLVFEGVIRKISPSFLSIVIFFGKDIFCVVGIYLVVSTKLTGASKQVAGKIKVLLILLYPLLCYNLFFDPILFLWGGKLYLLYTVTAVLFPIAFPPDSKNSFVIFILFILLLLLIAIFTGLYQLTLPVSHWLNQSVDGGSLENFSAGGKLRISSTFSFTGQYSFFLTFASAIYFSSFFLASNLKTTIFLNKYVIAVIGFLLLIGCFSTGGKTAVFGLGSIFVLGFILIIFKNPVRNFNLFFIPFVVFLFIIPIIEAANPEYFAAYTSRSERSGGSQGDIIARVLLPFSNLADSSILGNGLGVMTNGSDKVSTYAASIKLKTSWTESDFETIVWEGGFYLVFIWYGFRLFIIIYSFRILHSIKDNDYYNAAVFLFVYIMIIGLTGTLSIQPPIAIYFWSCLGGLLCVKKFDEHKAQLY